MADNQEQESDDVVSRAVARAKRAQASWGDIYNKARDDLFFQSDDLYAQWDQRDFINRVSTNRPAITVDQLSQFVHQVANDIRMNTPSITVIPGDGEDNPADEETADIIKGRIKKIEYKSRADTVYDTAAHSAVKCSIGFIRVDHGYVSDSGFEQEFKIVRVVNPLSCWIDPESVECDGSDAKYGFVIDSMLVSDFKKAYPDKEPVSFESDDSIRPVVKDGDTIKIAEYFEIIESPDTLVSDDGVSQREVMKRRVMRYKLSGADVLEQTSFPGGYIPIVPVYGEEAYIDGQRQLYSLIRRAKPAQRMYNYWASLETELLMMQPRAPVMAPAGSVENYAADWQDPSKAAVLRYDYVVDGVQMPKPERLAPPTVPTGIVNARRECLEDIKASMGLYNSSLGNKSNAISGKAINEQKQEGDVATYHFADNLTRSITQVGKIIVSGMAEIEDTPRKISITDDEETTKYVGINGLRIPGQERDYYLNRGKYDVRVITGPSFTTKRQEAFAALNDIFMKNPQLMPVMGDLYFQSADFANANAMAERFKKTMDPKLLEDPKNAPQQDPRVPQMEQIIQQGAAELQAMQQQIMQLEQQLKSKDADIAQKAQASQQDAQIEILKLQMERAKNEQEAQFKAAEIALKSKELDLKAMELQQKIQMQEAQQEHETIMRAMEPEESEEDAPDNQVGVYQGD